MISKKIVVLIGATAVGKTHYSIQLAKKINAEIVSCDSMQLYKFMDIGSAKPTKKELQEVPHHLIGEIDPRKPFTVSNYQIMAKAAINDIFSRNMTPLITGGTGLYLNSLLYDMDFGVSAGDNEYRKELESIAKNNGPKILHDRLRKKDPEAAERIHPNNVKRVIRALESVEKNNKKIGDFSNINTKTNDYGVILMGIKRNREELYQRINIRTNILIENGLVQEVENLINMGLTKNNISMMGIGYKEIIDYIDGAYDLETAIELIQKNTRHYAKRQITWFNRYEDMIWFDLSSYCNEEDALKDMIAWVKKNA